MGIGALCRVLGRGLLLALAACGVAVVGAVCVAVRRDGAGAGDPVTALELVPPAQLLIATGVVLAGGRLAAVSFGVLVDVAAERGGTSLMRTARIAAGLGALALGAVLGRFAPEGVARVAVMLAAVTAFQAARVSKPRPGPGTAGWVRWLSQGGSPASMDAWLDVVLRHAKATGDVRPAEAFVQRVTPCLAPPFARSWPGYVTGFALSAAGRYADAAARAAELRERLADDDVLRGAVEHIHVDAVLTHALATGGTPETDFLDDCDRILARLTPDDANPAGQLHTKAMVLFFRGRYAEAAAMARRSRDGVSHPRDGALVDATIAIALARDGDLEQARHYLGHVPHSCPLHERACHETELHEPAVA